MTSKVRSFGNPIIYVIFTISGASALVYQVIWSRWLGLIFGNTTVSVSIVLGSFMLGLGLGSWISGRLLYKIKNPLKAYSILELGIGIFAVLFPFLTKIVEIVFTQFTGVETPLGLSLTVRGVLVFLLLSFPTTLMGATLPFLTDFFHRSPEHSSNWKSGASLCRKHVWSGHRDGGRRFFSHRTRRDSYNEPYCRLA